MKKVLCLLLAILLLPVTAGAEAYQLSPSDPQVLTLWHYYTGAQQRIFEEMIRTFNESVGLEKGIVIAPISQGDVDDLANKVIASANQRLGSDPMPDIFAAYADSANVAYQLGLVADLSAYMTEEEIDAYIPAYIEEGRLGGDSSLQVFPVAKSTEIMLLNKTEWDAFAAQTDAEISMLSTWEGIVEVSRMYYEWSGGKAFFGRDAFANYILVGSVQLGTELFQVEKGQVTLNIDEQVMRRLWDNYVVPYANGWFGAYGRYRSDDVKTGRLVALVGSTSGALYFPNQVTNDDGTTYPIERMVLPLPNFENTQPYAVQQGAGMVVTKSTPAREYAATLFLKWFTGKERDLTFSLTSGYLPVTKIDAQAETLFFLQQDVSDTMLDILTTGIAITNSYRLHVNRPFQNSVAARQVVETSMADAAVEAHTRFLQLTANGVDAQSAARQVAGDEAFAAWLEEFRTELTAVLQ